MTYIEEIEFKESMRPEVVGMNKCTKNDCRYSVYIPCDECQNGDCYEPIPPDDASDIVVVRQGVDVNEANRYRCPKCCNYQIIAFNPVGASNFKFCPMCGVEIHCVPTAAEDEKSRCIFGSVIEKQCTPSRRYDCCHSRLCRSAPDEEKKGR